MGPNFCSHLLTGSCFSKPQSAGGPRARGLRAKGLRHLLKLARLWGPGTVPASPHPPQPLSCRICLGVKQYIFPLEAFVFLKLFFFSFLKGKTTYRACERFLHSPQFCRVSGRSLPHPLRPAWPCFVASFPGGSSLAKCPLPCTSPGAGREDAQAGLLWAPWACCGPSSPARPGPGGPADDPSPAVPHTPPHPPRPSASRSSMVTGCVLSWLFSLVPAPVSDPPRAPFQTLLVLFWVVADLAGYLLCASNLRL